MHAATAVPPSTLLHRALLADAAVSGATGALMLVAAGLLAPLLGLPAELLRWAGIALIPFAAFVLWVARRNSVSRTATLAIVIVNALWTVGSLLLLLAPGIAPTIIGYVFTIGQALAVALFAELQYVGLRRESAALRAPERRIHEEPKSRWEPSALRLFAQAPRVRAVALCSAPEEPSPRRERR
ncbi:MAG: hypothetical protein ACREOF_09095 [Gemmatimonadales bacterium]